jgi:predicted RecA/RadA family phage recombinase
MADTQQVQYASARVELGADVAEKGLMICIKTTDAEAYKAADAANYRVIGINEEVGDEGDTITAYSGIFLFDNSTVYPVTQAYIGAKVYVEDEKTVSTSAGSNSIVAGTCVDVVSSGVWVRIGDCVTL